MKCLECGADATEVELPSNPNAASPKEFTDSEGQQHIHDSSPVVSIVKCSEHVTRLSNWISCPVPGCEWGSL